MSKLKHYFKRHEISPIKRWGQNYLINEKIIEKIKETAKPSKKDIILEIGAGIGNLTKKIAKNVKRVIAVEKDKRMIEILKENLSHFKNVEIKEGDVRDIIDKIIAEIQGNYKIVSNIPYYLSSFLFKKIFELKKKPKLIVFLVQKEVAQKICAKPPKMNLLALLVQFFAKPEIVCFVSKNSFWPKPKVDSAIIKLTLKNEKKPVTQKLFLKIIKAGFSHPRKRLVNNLSQNLSVEKEKMKMIFFKNNIELNKRAQELSLKDWLKLAQSVKEIHL